MQLLFPVRNTWIGVRDSSRNPRRFSKPRTYLLDLLAGMAAFGPSTMLPDWVQTQPRRSSHADTVTNRILQASANFQNLSQSCYPLLLRNYSLLLLTSSTPRIKFAQYSSFKSAMSI